MPRTRKMAFVAGALLVPSAAFAHGEEVFVTLGAQLSAVVACVVASVVLVKPLGYRALAIVGSLLGVTISWLVTENWPYLSNRVEITVLDVGLPILGTMLVVVLFKVLSHEKKVP